MNLCSIFDMFWVFMLYVMWIMIHLSLNWLLAAGVNSFWWQFSVISLSCSTSSYIIWIFYQSDPSTWWKNENWKNSCGMNFLPCFHSYDKLDWCRVKCMARCFCELRWNCSFIPSGQFCVNQKKTANCHAIAQWNEDLWVFLFFSTFFCLFFLCYVKT